MKSSKGFTLIELLVVVLIIGVLAAIAFPKYLLVVERSRATQAITTLGSLQNAMSIYIMSHGNPSVNSTTPAIWDNLDYSVNLPYASADGYMRCDDHFRYSISYRAGDGTFYLEAQKMLGKSKTCSGYPAYGLYYTVSRDNKGNNYKSCSAFKYGDEVMQSMSKKLCAALLEENIVNRIS